MSLQRSRRKEDDEFAHATRAAKYVLARTQLRPVVGVELGSGLGGYGETLDGAVRIAYEKIPYFPRARIAGHAGRMAIGRSGGAAVAVLEGRAHVYEGYGAREVVLPIRTLWLMGARAIVLTSAVGGIDPRFRPGDLVVLSDHLNLQGTNPLIGPHDERFGPQFPDMSEPYSKKFRRTAIAQARRLGLRLREGVYAAVHGPSYETPAEIRALGALGAGVVGMSTVPETIVARQMGMDVLGICCVTNLAAGVGRRPAGHDSVLRVARQAKERLTALLDAVIPRLAKEEARVDR